MKVATNQERLNELFDADPRTDSAIAADLGVSKQTISAWRSGIRSPKKTMLIQIAETYKVNISWLMGWDDEGKEDRQVPIFVSDSEKFVKLIRAMPFEDYKLVIDAFRRAEQKLREQGVKL